jgi:DNA repair ATPase RecN
LLHPKTFTFTFTPSTKGNSRGLAAEIEMADPSSTTASVLAVATAAGQATKLLQETIQRYKERNRTFRTLQNELEDITNILDALAQVTNIDPLLWALLQGPINRYSQVCREFEQSVKDFSGNSKAGIQDWTKMEFMRGDMGEFVQTIAGYKSTIVVGLATINLSVTHTSLSIRILLTSFHKAKL